MPASVVTLEHLRSLIQNVEKPHLRERFSFSAMASLGLEGLPRGGLIEITGSGKTEAVVKFLAENPKLRVAWIEDQLTIYPLAFVQRKVPLHRVLFIEAQKEIYWAASQVLRSGLFEIIVMSFKTFLNEKVMRRLQLETEKANVGFFLLPENEEGSSRSISWPLSMRLNVKNRSDLESVFELNFARVRG